MKKRLLNTYELDIHLIPTMEEGEALSILKELKDLSGDVIKLEDPKKFNLAYTMRNNIRNDNGTYNYFDESFFGSIKFTCTTEVLSKLKEKLMTDKAKIIRHLITKTVKEDTRIPIEEEKTKESADKKNADSEETYDSSQSEV